MSPIRSDAEAQPLICSDCDRPCNLIELGWNEGFVNTRTCSVCKNRIPRTEKRWHCVGACLFDVCLPCAPAAAEATKQKIADDAPMDLGDWKEFEDVDAFSGQNAETWTKFADFNQAKRHCVKMNFGAFVTFRGNVYFRAQSPGDIGASMKKAMGSNLYLKPDDCAAADAVGSMAVGGFLQEICDQCQEPRITVKMQGGMEVEVNKGTASMIEIVLGSSSSIDWFGANKEQMKKTVVNINTKWVRCVRPPDGKVTTWRCYASRPPSATQDGLKCEKGHILEEGFVPSPGWMSECVECDKCHKDIGGCGLKWGCSQCDYDICLTCAESEVEILNAVAGVAAGAPPAAPAAAAPAAAPAAELSTPGAAQESSAPDPAPAFNPSARVVSMARPKVALASKDTDSAEVVGKRLVRLSTHGDMRGLDQTIKQAKRLNLDTAQHEQALQNLKDQGPFRLLTAA